MIEILLEKATQKEIEFRDCEQRGGHYYGADGFSRIAHPETAFQPYPDEKNLEKIVYRAYACQCGSRVSVEEGRAYMQQKYEKLKALNRHQELNRKYKVGD